MTNEPKEIDIIPPFSYSCEYCSSPISEMAFDEFGVCEFCLTAQRDELVLGKVLDV